MSNILDTDLIDSGLATNINNPNCHHIFIQVLLNCDWRTELHDLFETDPHPLGMDKRM